VPKTTRFLQFAITGLLAWVLEVSWRESKEQEWIN
jgi:hypothetical protein